jgi:pimeloyl-ACP methyl ester carboxylesterase
MAIVDELPRAAERFKKNRATGAGTTRTNYFEPFRRTLQLRGKPSGAPTEPGGPELPWRCAVFAATALAPTRRAIPCPIGSLRAALRVVANLSGRRTSAHRAADPAGSMQVCARDGENFTVHARGHGLPVLLVHGLGGSHREWDKLDRQLAASHRVYTRDARGHGERSAAAGMTPTLATLADDVACVIERLGGERPLLVGHSMGALTVIDYLSRYGEGAVLGICLLDQSPRIVNDESWRCGLFGSFTQSQHEDLIARLKSDFVGTVFEEIARRLSPSLHAIAKRFSWTAPLLRRLIDGVRREALISLLESIGACDFRAVLAGLSVPALVVLGGRSHHYGNVPLADYYAGTLHRGTVTTYPSAAHSPHRQATAALARDLASFGATCLSADGKAV